MAQMNSIPEEISQFLTQHSGHLDTIPQIINLAFSGERKPEAWHVRIPGKQIVRGFNKAAPVTVMLPHKTWKKLLKKDDNAMWRKALADGQIHIHGDKTATAAFAALFDKNGVAAAAS
ncbi:MAG TPA: hypothetical protein ENJ29_11785 [Bacteroidetes bacterium]|nr:hypothetical protein [Bacteroidota bacterium]